MRLKKESALFLTALLVVCGLMLSVQGAAAATGEQNMSKDPGKDSGAPFLNVGSTKDGSADFLRFLEPDVAECSSNCCWASGCNVVCSETSCTASCGSETATYICSAS